MVDCNIKHIETTPVHRGGTLFNSIFPLSLSLNRLTYISSPLLACCLPMTERHLYKHPRSRALSLYPRRSRASSRTWSCWCRPASKYLGTAQSTTCSPGCPCDSSSTLRAESNHAPWH